MPKQTNITKEMQDQFNALTSGKYDNFALFSCFVDGAPAAAIVAVQNASSDDVQIIPLFVSVTKKMKVTDHDGIVA